MFRPATAPTVVAMAVLMAACTQEPAAVELCLAGEFNLGARLQGLYPGRDEFYPARFCVVTEDDPARVHFAARGHSNPDMHGEFAVAYSLPDRVRLINRQAPPDVEFVGASMADEALRQWRLDPVRIVEEIERYPDRVVSSAADGWRELRYSDAPGSVRVQIRNGKLHVLQTQADMPLRGRVPVTWRWTWVDDSEPAVTLLLDDEVLFRGRAKRRRLEAADAAALWQPSGDEAPRAVPGEAWPARIDMQLETLADGVFVVRGVRTGFHHLVVDTDAGLVVADAPAGWVELTQIPPADLVPGLGISGLSERLIDFLATALPGRPIRAVALTHAHDDHAGGARAFAAAGAEVYAPAGVADFLNEALNRPEMPADRLAAADGIVVVRPVTGRLVLDGASRAVELIAIDAGPHVDDALGVLVADAGFFFQSDLHVPNSEATTPRAERATTECWFARWAVENLPSATVVLGSHGLIRSPVARLAGYLENEICQRLE